MYYGSTTQATDFAPDDWKLRVFRAALWFIPRANPDFEPLFVHVRRWLVEVDDSGRAQREVALGSDGAPLFAAPDERNFGFWTDSDKAFSESELMPVSAAEFEQSWSRACAAAGTPNHAFKGRRAKRARP